MKQGNNLKPYNEKISIFHGMASTISSNTSGNFFPIFAMTILGATNYQVGLLSSLPPLLALLMTIPAAIMINRAHSQKKLVAFSVLFARLLFLAIIGIVYLPGGEIQGWVFIVLVAAMNVPNTLAGMGWQALISNTIDENRRGEFFSDRNRLLTIVGFASTFLIGILMKDVSNSVFAFQVLFGVSFFFGLVEVYFLMKHKEEPVVITAANEKKRLMDWSIFKHSNFVWFLFGALFFNFAWQMAWGIFNIYNVRVANATVFWLSMFSVGSMMAQFLSFPLWKKWAEKRSNVSVFVWAAMGMAATPFFTVLSANLYWLTFVQTATGFFVAGVTLVLFNLLLEQAPDAKRTYSITSYNVLLSLVSFAAPQFGIWLLDTYGIVSSMNVTSVLRFMAAILFFIISIRYAKASKPALQVVEKAEIRTA